MKVLYLKKLQYYQMCHVRIYRWKWNTLLHNNFFKLSSENRSRLLQFNFFLVTISVVSFLLLSVLVKFLIDDFLLVPSRNCWIGCINNFCKNNCFKFNTSYAIPIPYRCMYPKFDQAHISSLEYVNLLQQFFPYPSSCATSSTFLNKDPLWDQRWTSDSCLSGG